MDKSVICRLCLGATSCSKKISYQINEKIRFVTSQHKTIDICSCCKWFTCYECFTQLEWSYTFKQKLKCTEKVLTIQKNSKTFNGPIENEICRLCLQPCNKYNSYSLFENQKSSIPFSVIKQDCDAVFVMDLSLTIDPLMCKNCWELLQKTKEFIELLLRTQRAINNFVKKNKTEMISSESLKDMVVSDDLEAKNIETDVEMEDIESGKRRIKSDSGDMEDSSKIRRDKYLYKCTLCNFSSYYKRRAMQHLNTHKARKNLKMHKKNKNKDKIFTCYYCDFNTSSIHTLCGHLASHKRNMAPKLYCTLCSFTTLYRSALNIHIVHHITGRLSKIKCIYCKKFFETKRSHRNHQIKMHPDHCSTESKISLMIKHGAVHGHTTGNCFKINSELEEQCNDNVSCGDSIKREIDEQVDSRDCEIKKDECEMKLVKSLLDITCNNLIKVEIASKDYEMGEENQRVDINNLEIGTDLQMGVCEKEAIKEEILVSEIKIDDDVETINGDERNKEGDENMRNSQDYNCHICTKLDLKKHSKIHEKKIFFCNLCTLSTIHELYFEEHRKTHKIFGYKCEICQIIFNNQASLSNHLHKYHEKPKEF